MNLVFNTRCPVKNSTLNENPVWLQIFPPTGLIVFVLGDDLRGCAQHGPLGQAVQRVQPRPPEHQPDRPRARRRQSRPREIP